MVFDFRNIFSAILKSALSIFDHVISVLIDHDITLIGVFLSFTSFSLLIASLLRASTPNPYNVSVG